MLDLIIRGGQVVTPMGVGDWDVAVQGERIVAVAAAGAMGDNQHYDDTSARLFIDYSLDRCTEALDSAS